MAKERGYRKVRVLCWGHLVAGIKMGHSAAAGVSSLSLGPQQKHVVSLMRPTSRESQGDTDLHFAWMAILGAGGGLKNQIPGVWERVRCGSKAIIKNNRNFSVPGISESWNVSF